MNSAFPLVEHAPATALSQSRRGRTLSARGCKAEHEKIGDALYCTVSVKDEDGNWISKQDVGTESYSEAVKGAASDSFKRACFNFGIGRELYTAPFIWISSEDANIKQGGNGKFQCYDKFIVEQILYDNERNIAAISIKNTKTNKRVFLMDNRKKES